METLLRNILKECYKETNETLPPGINTMDNTWLLTQVKSYLKDKRYVIVFDSVQKVDFWDEIEDALLDNKLGSRIMITTRNLDVATYCKKSTAVQVHHLQPLPHHKAWQLFCEKAFHIDFNGICPPELEHMSNKIVEKCEGLPLAIAAIGGLCSTKDKTKSEWQNLLKNLSDELTQNRLLTSFARVLALSYDDLPYYLKSCILYFGIYPEDNPIRCTRLIRQWIAEGFIIKADGNSKPLEEIAQQYLTELIHRSLVQVSGVNYEGKPTSCRVHDLLRMMIIKKMKESSFCRVVAHVDDLPTSNHVTTRRLAIATDSSEVLRSIGQHSHIRSMYMFEEKELPDRFLSRFSSKAKLTKVLDLEGASLKFVPKDLGNIFHLRYLSLRKTNVKAIPRSIGKMKNLETLDLKGTLVHELPSEINKCTKLRHLLVYHRDTSFRINGETGVRFKGSIGNMTSLQKLYHVEVGDGGSNLITELRNLTKLRKLGLKKVGKAFQTTLCDSIQAMTNLKSLSISAINEDEVIDLQFDSSQMPQLTQLHLFGCLQQIPNWVPRLEYLVRLSIQFSKLKDDPLNSLKDLPNLLRLSISSQAYVGERLHFEEGFLKLKRLQMFELNNLNSIVIHNGALPSLEQIKLVKLPKLEEMPSSFQQLPSLQTLYLTDMPQEFENQAKELNQVQVVVLNTQSP